MLALVWISWCKKKSTCVSCGELIEARQPMVYSKFKGERHPILLRNHLHCWVKDALDWLEKHPYKHHGGAGRPKLNLSDEQKKSRLKLLMARNNIVYKQRRLAMLRPELAIAKQTAIQEKIYAICIQLASLGGAPKSWLG